MATTQPPAEGTQNGPTGPPTLSTITSLPPLPHPLHPRQANAAEALRVLRTLGDNATSGAVDYPYPTNTEYPLPPLPPIPVPTGASRRRRAEPVSRAPAPVAVPAIPEDSYLFGTHTLDSAVAAHNAAHPTMPATIHYDRSALLIHLGGLGYLWCLVRTLAADGSEAGESGDAAAARVLGVRCFLSREARAPPIHAVAPPGPSLVLGEHLKSLELSVLTLLYRLPFEVGLLESPCYRCGRFLSDIDGLPLNASGWIPPMPKRVGAEKVNGKAEEMDVDGKEEKKEEKGEKKDEEKDKKETEAEAKEREEAEAKAKAEAEARAKEEEENKDGRWVKWHASCRAP